MHRVLDLWIRLVSVLVPRAERGRWAEEWRGELDAVRRRGAGTARQLGWAWGVARASLRPEPWIDRRGRLAGNLRALRDLVTGRLAPGRILEL